MQRPVDRGARFALDGAVKRRARRPASRTYGRRVLTVRGFIAHARGVPRGIRYSDTNFQLLMVIAEHLTGRSMGALHCELLFEPLGLAHTWFPGEEPLQPACEPATVWLAR